MSQRLAYLSKALGRLETDARKELERAKLPATGPLDRAAELIDLMPDASDRASKRRDALWCQLMTAFNAHAVTDGIALIEALNLPREGEDDIARAIEAAFYAGRYSLRSLAEIGAKQKAAGRSKRSPSAAQLRGQRWRQQAEAMGDDLTESAKAKIIARLEPGDVSAETVRSHLK